MMMDSPTSHPCHATVCLSTILLAVALIALTPAPAAAQMDAPTALQPLHFRHIGPIGNRIAAVAGVEGDPHIYYVGAASGGIWKTEDGGLSWRPVFDDYPVHAIGSLAVAASDSQIVWAGTGEPHIRSNVSVGMINRIEWIRRQLYDLQAVMADMADFERLIEAAGELDGTLLAVEEDLYQTRISYTGQDRVRWPTRLFGHLQYLEGAVATVDFPPTDQAREVQQVLEERMQQLSEELAEVVGEDIEAFNRLLRELGLGPLVTGVE